MRVAWLAICPIGDKARPANHQPPNTESSTVSGIPNPISNSRWDRNSYIWTSDMPKRIDTLLPSNEREIVL